MIAGGRWFALVALAALALTSGCGGERTVTVVVTATPDVDAERASRLRDPEPPPVPTPMPWSATYTVPDGNTLTITDLPSDCVHVAVSQEEGPVDRAFPMLAGATKDIQVWIGEEHVLVVDARLAVERGGSIVLDNRYSLATPKIVTVSSCQ